MATVILDFLDKSDKVYKSLELKSGKITQICPNKDCGDYIGDDGLCLGCGYNVLHLLDAFGRPNNSIGDR